MWCLSCWLCRPVVLHLNNFWRNKQNMYQEEAAGIDIMLMPCRNFTLLVILLMPWLLESLHLFTVLTLCCLLGYWLLLRSSSGRTEQNLWCPHMYTCGNVKSTQNWGFNRKDKYEWRFLAGKPAMNRVLACIFPASRVWWEGTWVMGIWTCQLMTVFLQGIQDWQW